MISDFQRAKYEAWFGCLDHSGNGVLDESDLSIYATDAGWEVSMEAEEKLRASVAGFWEHIQIVADQDENNEVDKTEFVTFCESLKAETEEAGGLPDWATEFIDGIFSVLDLNGDGEISEFEYSVYLAAINAAVPSMEVFEKLDLNGDGGITIDEIETLPPQFITSDDPAEPGNLPLTGNLPA